jgi:hypothetical protein
MTLSDLGNIGEFIGALAVVLSLLYLAVQIRQNTRQIRATTFQGVARGWQDYMYALSSDDRASTWLKGSVDPAALNEVENLKYFILIRAFFRGYENDYYQYRQGTFDAEPWEGYLNALRNDVLFLPGVRAIWKRDRGNYNREFAAFVDRQLESVPVSESASAAELVQERLGTEKAAV